MDQKGNTAHIIAIVVLILVIIYFAFVRQPGSDTSNDVANVIDSSETASADDDSDALAVSGSLEESDDQMTVDLSDDMSDHDDDDMEIDMDDDMNSSSDSSADVLVSHTPVAPVTPVQTTNMQSVDLYFANVDKSAGNCSAVFRVSRKIPATVAIGTATLNELLTGPSRADLAAGYTTDIPLGSRLNSLRIENGVAYADFNAVTEGVSGQCSDALRRAQISQTLMQFPSVSTVVISIDGKSNNIFVPTN